MLHLSVLCASSMAFLPIHFLISVTTLNYFVISLFALLGADTGLSLAKEECSNKCDSSFCKVIYQRCPSFGDVDDRRKANYDAFSPDTPDKALWTKHDVYTKDEPGTLRYYVDADSSSRDDLVPTNGPKRKFTYEPDSPVNKKQKKKDGHYANQQADNLPTQQVSLTSSPKSGFKTLISAEIEAHIEKQVVARVDSHIEAFRKEMKEEMEEKVEKIFEKFRKSKRNGGLSKFIPQSLRPK